MNFLFFSFVNIIFEFNEHKFYFLNKEYNMESWIKGKVIKNYKWTDYLFSLVVHAPIKPFIAGQFTRLALDVEGIRVQRAYSYVNSPKNKFQEFYCVLVPFGKLTPHLQNLNFDDSIYVSENAKGSFILENVPSCKILWMFSTGTAIGPFLSILQFGKDLSKFKKIILVHAVRYCKDLNYFSLMKVLQKKYNKKLDILIITSREHHFDSLTGRIPNLIKNGVLEKKLGKIIDPSTSHVMLCGNPGMIKETQDVLTERGMYKHSFHNRDGHITCERYW